MWCTGLHLTSVQFFWREIPCRIKTPSFVYSIVGGTCHSREHIYVITSIYMDDGGIGVLSCFSVFPLRLSLQLLGL